VTDGKRSPKWDDNEEKSMVNILYEGVAMRDINKKIRRALDHHNQNCIIINNNWEDTPIWKKRNIAATLDLDHSKCLGLEIHANATQKMKGKATGFELFTWPGQSSSDMHARIYGEEFEKELPEHKHRRFKENDEKERRFGILKLDPIAYPIYMERYITETKLGFPIVLEEVGFMDNEYFCKKYLMTEDGRELIAMINVKAIFRIIDELY
jgi:hypothetical protein